jgi:NAD(P)-dependent dehydrogenase (short-subunit alcohol dehydrogenase family)
MPPGSSIVNILSIAAKTGFANWSAYCMSKFALEGLSQSVREELRDRKIRVINAYPTATDTSIWTHIEGEWPRHKMISPEDVASTVAYAVSSRGRYIGEYQYFQFVWKSLIGCKLADCQDRAVVVLWKSQR